MVKVVKKLFTMSVVTLTILWSVGIAALVPTTVNAVDCPELEAGDLFKVPGNTAVYLLNADMERMYFPNAEVYKTWYADYSGIVEIPNTCVDAYPAPSSAPYGVNYRPGSRLVKVEISPSVYVIEPDNTKTKIGSEEVAKALYGDNWAKLVRDVADVYWPNLVSEGSEITASALHDGMLVKSDDTVYSVDGGMLYEVDGDLGVATGDVRTVSASLISALEMASETVTSASLVENPTQTSATEDGETGDDTTPVVAGKLSVSLSANTPDGASIPDDVEGLKALTVNVKAGSEAVTVTGLKVRRTGASTHEAITSVFAKADGRRLGSVKSLGSTDEASILFSTGSNPVMIAANTSKTFDIFVNVTDQKSGNFAMSLVEVSSLTSATVAGLPVVGNTFSLVNIAAPDLTVAYESVGTSPSVGDTAVEVFKVKVTNPESNEDVYVHEMTLKNDSSTGTRVDSEEVINFTLYIDGETTPLATAELDSLRYLNFVFDEPLMIKKGGSEYKRFVVKADIVGGASHYLNLELDQPTDLVAFGSANNFPVDVATSGTTSDILVAGGDLNISIDTTNNPKASTLKIDTDNVVMLRAKLSATQQPIKLTDFGVYFEGTTIHADDYENLKVWVGNQLVIDEATPFSTTDTTAIISTSDEFEVSGTQDVRVEISSKSTTDSGDTLKVTLRAADLTAQRVSDDVAVTPGGNAAGNTMTFSAATFIASAAATPVSATYALGSLDVPFAGFTLVAGSASDMRVKSVKFALGGSGGTVDKNDVTNIRLMESNGTTVYATAKNLDSNKYVEFTNLQSLPYSLIGDGASKKIVVVADLASTFNDSDVTSVYLEMIDLKGLDEAGNEVEATISSSDITTTNEVNDDGATATITAASRGYLTVKQDGSTAQAHQLVATSQNNSLVTHKFTAYRENITLKKLVYTASTGVAADDEYTNLSLWLGNTKLVDGGQPSAGVVTFDLPTEKQVLVSTGLSNSVLLTLKGDLENSDNDVMDSNATHSWSLNDLANDVDATGATYDVYTQVETSSGTGVTLTSDETATTTIAISSGTSSTITVDDSTGMEVGDLIYVNDGSNPEYMLILAINSNVLTVGRGVAGTTAVAHDAAADVTTYSQKVAGNAQYFYANKIGIALDATPAGGDGKLRSITGMAVLRFRVTKDAVGTEPALLSSVTTTMSGVGATSTGGWYIANTYLYNIDTGLQVGSTVTTDLDASGDTAVFTSLAQEIDSDGTVFEVRVDITAADVDDNDSMSFGIVGFGSAGVAGAGAGAVTWSDTDTSGIDWVDTTITSLEGNAFLN